MNMHALNMWITDTATVVVGAYGLCTHNVGGVTAGRRDTTQVMLGVSLRARWDTTLVIIIITTKTY